MDLGQALKGVNGQVVELTSMQLEQLRPYNLKINNLIDNFLFYDYKFSSSSSFFTRLPLKSSPPYDLE